MKKNENIHFTIRIKPFGDESLTSYLLRFADANGVTILSFWNSLIGEKPRYAQFSEFGILDFVPFNKINLNNLSLATHIPTDNLLGKSFYYLLDKFNVSEEIQRSRFLSGMLREILHYCPLCFNEKAYNRLFWKLEGINTCINHRSKLMISCNFCNQEIKYKDIRTPGECPYCLQYLGRHKSYARVDVEELESQRWMYDSLAILNTPTNISLPPSEIALRILFILNDLNLSFDKEMINHRLGEAGNLQTLLQHARDSLSQKRVLHLSFVLSILYENKISMDSFLEIEIPYEFKDSVLTKTRKIVDKVFCLAPWCSNYSATGTLLKTGTSYKERKNGEVLKYYLICTECGCEYAIDEFENVIERTYFIRYYDKILSCLGKGMNLKDIEIYTQIPKDSIRRCIAYYL